MKLTTEDYMWLPKERLAELLVERDEEDEKNKYVPCPWTTPYVPDYPWVTYEDKTGPCFDGGPCNNPFHDCVNCPGRWNTGGQWTTNTTTDIKSNMERPETWSNVEDF